MTADEFYRNVFHLENRELIYKLISATEIRYLKKGEFVVHINLRFAHRLSQTACKLFLVLVQRVTLFKRELVNFCSQRCLIFQK